jgi:hypothetical protein
MMRRTSMIALATLGMFLMGGVSSAQMPGGPPGQAQPRAGHVPMMGGGMMGQGTMGMMCPMMGQMMGQGMMGMMGGTDAKAQGRMLQLRGEMLKAMGDVLIKHGRALEEGK